MSVQRHRRRMPFMISGWLLAAGILTACPRPVNNPVDPADDPTAAKPDPDDGDVIEPSAPPPPDAGPRTPMPTPPTAPTTPEPSPSVDDEERVPVQPASPPPSDQKNAPLAV